jgi:hypothetical protein
MLLYYLTPGQYSNATAPLCKSLTLLGTKKRASQEPNFNIDFNEHGRCLLEEGAPFTRCATEMYIFYPFLPGRHLQ